jgi:hypothetical protein
MATLNFLPEEILLEITKLVCGTSDGGLYYLTAYSAWKPSGLQAASLRLVNRRFARISRPFIFRHLVATYSATRRISEFLQQRDIAGLTQTVCLSGYDDGTTPLLSALSILKTLHITSSRIPIPATLPSLHTLHCNAIDLPTILQLLHASPRLHSLQISKCADRGTRSFPPVGELQSALHTLRILEPHFPESDLQRLLSSTPALKHLSYHAKMDDFHGLAFGRAIWTVRTSLEVLEVSVQRWFPTRIAIGSLAEFEKLRVLRMDYCWLVDEDVRGAGLLVNLLPTSLERIRLSFFADGPAREALLVDLMGVVEEKLTGRRMQGLEGVDLLGFRVGVGEVRRKWEMWVRLCKEAGVELVYGECAVGQDIR